MDNLKELMKKMDGCNKGFEDEVKDKKYSNSDKKSVIEITDGTPQKITFKVGDGEMISHDAVLEVNKFDYKSSKEDLDPYLKEYLNDFCYMSKTY